MVQKNQIPKLRFPEFVGEWETKTLGEIAYKKIKKNKDNLITNVFTNSASRGIVNQRDYFDKDIANQNNLLNYYVVEKDDFIYNPRISSYAPVGPISRNHIGLGVMSPLYSVFKIKMGNLEFYETYFSTSKWHEYMESIANYGARADRMNIITGDFYLMPLPFPTIPEQKRIAAFFTVLGKKTEALKQKKALLEQYKKGVMQKLFSQELRFKDEKGNEFPRWEKKTLGDLLEFKNGINASKEKYGKGVKFINVLDILSNESITYDTIIGSIDIDNSTLNKYSVSYGDILFQRSSETREEVGSASVYLDKEKTATFGGFVIRGKKIGEYDPVFLNKLLKSNSAREAITSKSGGSTRYNVGQGTLSSVLLYFPSLPEQTKIANFLSAIDDKIKSTENQIQQTMQYKKGLLQNMFI